MLLFCINTSAPLLASYMTRVLCALPSTRLEHYFCSFFAGVNLSLLTEEMLKACQFFKEHRHMTCLITMMINQQTVLELQGAINEEASEAMDFFQQTSIPGMIKVR